MTLVCGYGDYDREEVDSVVIHAYLGFGFYPILSHLVTKEHGPFR